MPGANTEYLLCFVEATLSKKAQGSNQIRRAVVIYPVDYGIPLLSCHLKFEMVNRV